MTEALYLAVQLAMLLALGGIFYVIFQVVEVIREERERLMWYRHAKAPVRTDDDQPAQ